MTKQRRVVVNATGSTSGGGLTYVVALLEELARNGPRGLSWQVLLQASHLELLRARDFRCPSSVSLVVRTFKTTSHRVLWEQLALPSFVSGRAGDVLLSAANFGPLLLRRRHILLSRNVLYFAASSDAGMSSRVIFEGALARASARGASEILVASESMAEAVKNRSSVAASVVRFGPGLAAGTSRPGGRWVFLHRTGWAPYKRFDKILHAARLLAHRRPGEFLVASACDPTSDFASSFPQAGRDRRLLADPVVSRHVRIEAFEPGERDILDGHGVLMPSPYESFSFPLAEAVAFGLPVVAAESSLSREMCGEQALYVDPDNVEQLSDAMERVMDAGSLPPAPKHVRKQISWRHHVDQLADCVKVA